MQIDLNDDQMALLVDLLRTTTDDLAETSYEIQESDSPDNYAGVVLHQAHFRMKDLYKTVTEQSGHNWVHNVASQRMEPRFKAREEQS